jgi:hypothetical protein
MKVLNGGMTKLRLWKEVPWVVEMPVLEASHSPFDGIHHDVRGSTKKVEQCYVRHN